MQGKAGEHQIDGAKVSLGHAYGASAQYFAMAVLSSSPEPVSAGSRMTLSLQEISDRLEIQDLLVAYTLRDRPPRLGRARRRVRARRVHRLHRGRR